MKRLGRVLVVPLLVLGAHAASATTPTCGGRAVTRTVTAEDPARVVLTDRADVVLCARRAGPSSCAPATTKVCGSSGVDTATAAAATTPCTAVAGPTCSGAAPARTGCSAARGADTLDAGAVNDVVRGDDDVDVLDGGAGRDGVKSGAGADTVGYSGQDSVDDDAFDTQLPTGADS